MTPAVRDILSTALTLLLFSLLGAGLLSGTHGLTHTTIEATERANQQRLIAQTLPAGSFDNDLTAGARPLPATPELGLKRPGQAYVASKDGQPVAVVLETVAPDGYSGEIRLLVGILADGRVAGVRVTAHRETPGLGDYIEVAKGNWIHQFDGRALGDPPAEQWRVRKDGGRFDYMAGATITPRAVVKAVRRSLEYFAAHRDELLNTTP
jgi:electron transport complex protein RnfG